MLFNTLAEYDAAIAEARQFLSVSMKNQVTVASGAAQGLHTQHGDVRAIKEWLELLGKERETMLARDRGGTVNHIQFGRED